MDGEGLSSPVSFLKERLGVLADEPVLRAYEAWWAREGRPISEGVDRAGTPWLKMFDRLGTRVDEILYPPGYKTLLHQGYQAGVVWRVFETASLVPSYLLGYVTSFYDSGLYCPYVVSLATAVALEKYGTREREGPLFAGAPSAGRLGLAGCHMDDGSEGRLRPGDGGGDAGPACR